MTTLRSLLALTATAAGLSSCAWAPAASPDGAPFGLAAASLQAQAVPPSAEMLPAESSGARGVAAIGRYERGAVKVPPSGPTSEIAAQTTSGEQPAGDTP